MIKKASTQEELEQIHDLACYAFNSEHTIEQKKNYIEKNQYTTNYVVTNQSGDITSQLICYPFEVTVEGRLMKMAGIGDVASYPETRGNGSIRQLFSTLFQELYENNIPLSYLAPFSQIFYRKFGYENLFISQEIRIPKATITQLVQSVSGDVRRVKWESDTVQESIKRLYKKTLGKQNGTLIRPDFWWGYQLKPCNNINIAICYNHQHQATGYLFYQLISNTEFLIKELAYENPTAMKQLLNFVASHSGSFDSFVFSHFTDDMLFTQFTETQAIEKNQQSGMMGRIVDFKTFIEQYPFISKNDISMFYLEVIDDFCEWNHGVFKVVIKNGQATCTKAEQAKIVDYCGSIQNWLPIFMGVYSLDKGVSYQLIEKKSDDRRLSSLIQSSTPQLYDYF